MSEIKGYTVDEVAESRKNSLIGDYNFCKCKLAEIKRHEEEINSIRNTYNKKIVEYRIASVDRVLDYIRCAKITDVRRLDILLCHCQNKLHGNIDGVELDLSVTEWMMNEARKRVELNEKKIYRRQI